MAAVEHGQVGAGFDFAPMRPDLLAAVQELEAASYPADEAASAEGIKFRTKVAPSLFYVSTTGDGALVGFVCGTTTDKQALDEDTMSAHVEGGQVLCIHSVVTAPQWQRQGIATWMVHSYLRAVTAAHPELTRVALLAKEHTVPLYTKCGFAHCGVSPVHHGADPWNDLQMTIPPTSSCLAQETVDAFASVPFAGNPAAVVVLPGLGSLPPAVNPDDAATTVFQALAVENNLSETAFVQRDAGEPGAWTLRWFTPGCEVGMCGHATLATAAVLWESHHIPAAQGSVHFNTAAGPLTVTRQDAGYVMDFPAVVPKAAAPAEAAEWTAALQKAMGAVEPMHPTWWTTPGLGDIIAVVGESVFESLPGTSSVDMAAISTIPARGVIVTTAGTVPSGEGGDVLQGPAAFRSRFFGPNCGVPEDPVTGSAHCALAPLWVKHWGSGGAELHGHQASARGGHVGVTWVQATGRVLLRGQAVMSKSARLSAAVTALVLGQAASAK